MRRTAVAVTVAIAAASLTLVAAGSPAGAACKSAMKPGTWTGTATQEMVVQGTADSGFQVDETGTSTGELAIEVACNGKAKGRFVSGSFTLTGTAGAAGFTIPIDCRGQTDERPVAGKVKKGSGGRPVITLTYGPAASESFECAPGPLGDALNAAFAESGAATGTTVPDAPTGLELPTTEATKRVVRGTSWQATGGFDPLAVATESLESLGLRPTITQAFELTRT